MTDKRLPPPAERWISLTANATALRQTWTLFGRAAKYDCWYVYHARLKDGRTVDLLTGGPSSAYQRPDLASRAFPNHRWRKLHWRLPRSYGKAYRQPLAEYFARQWNASHPPEEQVVQVDLYCYQQKLELGRPAEAYTRHSLARVTLGDGEAGAFAAAARELDL